MNPNKDLYIFDFDKQDYLSNQHWLNIQVCSWEGNQNSLVNMNKLQGYYYGLLYIVKMDHKVKVNKDSSVYYPRMVELKNQEQMKGFFNRNYRNIKRNVWGLTWLFITSHKWISSQRIWTTTDWGMIDNFARCIVSARIETGIGTSLTNTGFIKGAIRICNALWTTIWRRTNVILFTWTNSLSVIFFTSWVETTGRWSTWILIWLNDRCDEIQWIVEFIWVYL